MPRIKRTLLETPEYWAGKTLEQLRMARRNHKRSKCGVPRALLDVLEEREKNVVTTEVKEKRRNNARQQTEEYWRSRSPKQLKTAIQNYRKQRKEIPAALTAVMEQYNAEQIATPAIQTTTQTPVPATDGINIVTKTPVGADFRGTLYDIAVNGRIIAASRVNPTLETALDNRLLVLRDGADAMYEIYDAYAAPYNINRPNPNITRVIQSGDSLLLYMTDFSTEVISPANIPADAPRYDLSQMSQSKVRKKLPPRPQPEVGENDTEINLDDGNYHLFTKKTQSNFYDVYLNGVKIMHEVPGISTQTFFDDRMLGIRINNFNQRFNDWYLFDSNMRLYRPNYKFPLNIKIRDITRDGARLKLYMSNGDMQYLDCRHLIAYKSASHMYKIHD